MSNLDHLFSKELFLKKVSHVNSSTLQNIYCLSRQKVTNEMESFEKDGLPKCFAVICQNCFKICKYGAINRYHSDLGKHLECDYCFHKDILTDKHPGLFIFLFNENAKGLTHNPDDSLEEKLYKSF